MIDNDFSLEPAMPSAHPDKMSGSPQMDILAALWELLAKRTKKYTAGDSSSVRVEAAQELLKSICFTLELDINNNLKGIEGLLPSSLDECFSKGIARIEEQISVGKALWQTACTTLPGIENISQRDTLKSIGGFWRLYDYHFFAHEIPCDIDYQLCLPVSDSLLGIDYINEYLRRIIIENELISRFEPSRCISILKGYCPDYVGQLINLYDPIATAAIGLALAGGKISGLNITPGIRRDISGILEHKTRGEAIRMLQAAALRVCAIFNIRSPGSRQYIHQLAENLYMRVDTAIFEGGLDGIFVSGK